MEDPKVLMRSEVDTRNLNYKKGTVGLNVQAKLNSKQDLKDLIECLEAAIADVKELLQKIK